MSIAPLAQCELWIFMFLNSDTVPVADLLLEVLSVSFDTARFAKRATNDDGGWAPKSLLIVLERVETAEGCGMEVVLEELSLFASSGWFMLDVLLLSNLWGGDELVGSGKT
jgi:hypothetical protein